MPTIFLNKNQYASNGGKEMVLTQTQYDNLSEQDKMNGMTYYICDADSDKNGDFQPVIYNTNEREIGVWCDGKPLYQKTISFTIPSNNWDYFDIASDIDTIIDYTGVVKDYNDNFQHIFFNRYDSGNTTFYTTIVIQNGAKKLFFRTYIAMNNCTAYVTIRYTKATDTSGSGSWTPGGVPAVHYSEEEQVIGTWIDGKTIYQKTLTYTNQTQRPSDWTTLETFSDIDQVIKIDGFIDVSNGQRMSNQYYFRLVFQNNALKYYCAELAAGNGDITTTIQYTKTTS